MASGYWSRNRLIGAGAIVVVGGLLITRNVMTRVENVARSPAGTHCVASSDCASGNCISYNARYICTEPCGPSGACPGATHCADVEVTKGGKTTVQKYCVP